MKKLRTRKVKSLTQGHEQLRSDTSQHLAMIRREGRGGNGKEGKARGNKREKFQLNPSFTMSDDPLID